MRKTQKKVFGLFGLILVAAMTVFAASLPSPSVAANSSGVVDTVIIRVVGEQPNVYFVDPTDGSSFINANQTVDFNYENISTAVISLTYDDGTTTQTYTLDTIDTTGQTGGSLNIDLSTYGYGEFTLSIVGEGYGGATDTDVISFSYYPFTAEAEKDTTTGNPKVILNYDDGNTDIDKIVINIYDEDGNLVESVSPVTVIPNDKDALLPFAENNLPAGKYKFEITAYNEDGEPLYKPYEIIYNYEPKAEPTPDEEEEEDMIVPNTGGLFEVTNISQSDYLATGLIVFLITGVGGAIFIAKRKDSKR